MVSGRLPPPASPATRCPPRRQRWRAASRTACQRARAAPPTPTSCSPGPAPTCHPARSPCPPHSRQTPPACRPRCRTPPCCVPAACSTRTRRRGAPRWRPSPCHSPAASTHPHSSLHRRRRALTQTPLPATRPTCQHTHRHAVPVRRQQTLAAAVRHLPPPRRPSCQDAPRSTPRRQTRTRHCATSPSACWRPTRGRRTGTPRRRRCCHCYLL